jgi:ribonuclease T1
MWRVIRLGIFLAAALAAYGWWSGHERTAATPGDAIHAPSFLPPEAIDTLRAIERGGPFSYDRDGVVFQNRERRLPDRPRGYYHEYTVRTPGASDRGARRIIAGGAPPEVYYYTDDHYRSFRRVEPPP